MSEKTDHFRDATEKVPEYLGAASVEDLLDELCEDAAHCFLPDGSVDPYHSGHGHKFFTKLEIAAELIRRFAALEAERDEAIGIISELSGQNCEVINDTKCYCDWHVPAAGISCGRCRAISWHKANIDLMQKWAIKSGELAERRAKETRP